MQKVSKFYWLIVTIASANMSLALACYAGPKQQEQPVRRVRATTGVESVQGWEQGLVRGNPNLARWHWDPIYSYKQGYVNLPVQSGMPDTAKNGLSRNKPRANYYNKPAFQYPVKQVTDNRPKHIPFSPEALEEVQAKMRQPEKVVIPNERAKTEEQVSGVLSQPVQSNKQMEPGLSTYGELYSRKEKLGTSLKYNSQKTSVYGQLLNGQSKNRYNGTKATKSKGQY